MTAYNDRDLSQVPEGLPVPLDDGSASHLVGMHLPDLLLPSTDGTTVHLGNDLLGISVIYCYPRTGVPGVAPLVEDWDLIPGARGCTPQTCAYRDHYSELKKFVAHVYGLSTQDTPYQQELVQRLHLPFHVLSDQNLELVRTLRLPTMQVAGLTLIKRLTLIVKDGRIVHVNYPVFPSNEDAANTIRWLHENCS